MISVLSVVKGRYDITLDSFASIWDKSSDENNIEHLIMFDLKEEKMKKIVEDYAERSVKLGRKVACYHVAFEEKAYKYRSMHRHYWNRLALTASGSIVFGLCNDMFIDTYGYDKIIERAVDNFEYSTGHNYFQILIGDDFEEDHEYSPCLVMTRPCVEVFNGIAPDEISSQGADQYVYNIFKSTDSQSIIDLRDYVKITQKCIQNGTYKEDEVQNERPVFDQDRAEWPFFYDLLYKKGYYYHKLNNLILRSIMRKIHYEKN